MKITLAFAIALVLQAVSAAPPSSSSSVATPSSIGDKVAQDLAEKFVIFRWEANNTFAKESFAFELNEPSRLQVVDFKHHGDVFDVFDHGKKIGSTSNVVYDENVETYAATPQEALSDDHFSKGAFSLDKGKHNITIMAHGPYEVGSAALRLVQRTNLVLAQGQDGKEDKENDDEEEEEEEGEEEEEAGEEEKSADNDKANWQKMYLKRKNHYDHKHSGGDYGKYHGDKGGYDKYHGDKGGYDKYHGDKGGYDKYHGYKGGYDKHHGYNGGYDKHHGYNGGYDKHHGYNGGYDKYHGYKGGYDQDTPNYHRYIPNRVADSGPATVTHWEVVRQTAVPYATRVGYEHGDYQ